ncbi:flagellin [Vibrio gallaecicus]|uniref:flagellin n=1 Tax=Vibrio gallaecicus TaxID=552386 RepID=UPI0010C99F96|nr:flagellin [Vibrio gallaecicus]MDN3613549.1 flagellin [Vibrio gallaecicus]
MVSLKTNMSAMIAQKYMGDAQADVVDAQSKLSSGSRIVKASDDAAGLQIANRLYAQTRGIDTAQSNANNAYSIAQTAEGALHESTNMLQKLRELALQSANGANTQNDRESMHLEAEMLKDDLDRIALTTTFAGEELFDGYFGKKSFYLGPDANGVSLNLKNMRTDHSEMGGNFVRASDSTDENWSVTENENELKFDYNDRQGKSEQLDIRLKTGDDVHQVASYINGQQDVMKASVTEDFELQFFASTKLAPEGFEVSGSFANSLAIGDTEPIGLDDLDLSNVGDAQLGIAVVDASLKYVDGHRSEIGGFQNGVSRTIDNLTSMDSNISVAEGSIRDTDYARASTRLVKSQILGQATSALYAQANQNPTAALSLLG